MSQSTYILAGVHTVCYHCGEDCDGGGLVFDQKPFCCSGCQTVYELLEQSGMDCYYDLNQKPGTSRKAKYREGKYNWLDDVESAKKLLQYSDEDITIAAFNIPAIHCSSCIYLLENLYKINPAIVRAQVNFLQKEARITFKNGQISLRQVVELIARIGYEPRLNMSDLEQPATSLSNQHYYLKIGVAFFCFGNIMLLSFPEYLGIDTLSEHPMRRFFGYANFLLALPVLFYSAREFFASAYVAIRHKSLNMDIPIVLGMVVMFIRSSYDIFMQQGAGYMDTLASLTLLMLIGRLFQNKTYATLSFERDYRSYFPVSVSKITGGTEQTIALSQIKVGDKIIVRNEELIPADSTLLNGVAMIDYSFVTGESKTVPVKSGDKIYAGGKQMGSAIKLELVNDVSHSYLTQLWNDDAFKNKSELSTSTLNTKVSRYFTPAVILISLISGLYWMQADSHKALNAFTAVLIITCPCALALSAPFTLGNVIRILGKHGIYLKNTFVIEKMAKIRTIVFDKTGTLTNNKSQNINYQGTPLTNREQIYVASLTHQSSHPLSKKISTYLHSKKIEEVTSFHEMQGKGIEGMIQNGFIRAGALDFAGGVGRPDLHDSNTSTVHISIDGLYKGYYEIRNDYRTGLGELIERLKNRFDLYVLSGDNNAEKKNLEKYIQADRLLFDQQPLDKLNFIKTMQDHGHNKVMMIGDGLNDAGALRQSDIGLVISEDTNNFSPACDGIVEAGKFIQIDSLINYSRSAMRIIKISYTLSLLYNIAGIYLAVQGTMSPIVAAILMPISSITIISFSTLASYILGRAHGFAQAQTR
ncbi:MAG: ccoI [Bacteroidetes bacterium]|nr:ccoI [Bacteroidota bacterium]